VNNKYFVVEPAFRNTNNPFMINIPSKFVKNRPWHKNTQYSEEHSTGHNAHLGEIQNVCKNFDLKITYFKEIFDEYHWIPGLTFKKTFKSPNCA
jgi:hypothetical protein